MYTCVMVELQSFTACSVRLIPVENSARHGNFWYIKWLNFMSSDSAATSQQEKLRNLYIGSLKIFDVFLHFSFRIPERQLNLENPRFGAEMGISSLL